MITAIAMDSNTTIPYQKTTYFDIYNELSKNSIKLNTLELLWAVSKTKFDFWQDTRTNYI